MLVNLLNSIRIFILQNLRNLARTCALGFHSLSPEEMTSHTGRRAIKVYGRLHSVADFCIKLFSSIIFGHKKSQVETPGLSKEIKRG
jgi:hypothetical protein